MIGFDPPSYNVSEGAGSAEVIVKLWSGTLSSPVTLTLTTLDGSAGGAYNNYSNIHCCISVPAHTNTYLQQFLPRITVLTISIYLAPGDYSSVSQYIVFNPGDEEVRVHVLITDDSVYEPQESFTAMLDLVTMGAAVRVDPDTANVQIFDDDGL